MDVPAVFMRDEDVKCQVGCQWLEGIRRVLEIEFIFTARMQLALGDRCAHSCFRTLALRDP